MPASRHPLSLDDAEEALRHLTRQLLDQTEAYDEVLHEYAEADHAYDVAYAEALVAQPRVVKGEKTTDAERKAMTLLHVERLAHRRTALEAGVKACAERGRNLREAMESMRSLNANVREVTRGN